MLSPEAGKLFRLSRKFLSALVAWCPFRAEHLVVVRFWQKRKREFETKTEKRERKKERGRERERGKEKERKSCGQCQSVSNRTLDMIKEPDIHRIYVRRETNVWCCGKVMISQPVHLALWTSHNNHYLPHWNSCWGLFLLWQLVVRNLSKSSHKGWHQSSDHPVWIYDGSAMVQEGCWHCLDRHPLGPGLDWWRLSHPLVVPFYTGSNINSHDSSWAIMHSIHWILIRLQSLQSKMLQVHLWIFWVAVTCIIHSSFFSVSCGSQCIWCIVHCPTRKCLCLTISRRMTADLDSRWLEYGLLSSLCISLVLQLLADL